MDVRLPTQTRSYIFDRLQTLWDALVVKAVAVEGHGSPLPTTLTDNGDATVGALGSPLSTPMNVHNEAKMEIDVRSQEGLSSAAGPSSMISFFEPPLAVPPLPSDGANQPRLGLFIEIQPVVGSMPFFGSLPVFGNVPVAQQPFSYCGQSSPRPASPDLRHVASRAAQLLASVRSVPPFWMIPSVLTFFGVDTTLCAVAMLICAVAVLCRRSQRRHRPSYGWRLFVNDPSKHDALASPARLFGADGECPRSVVSHCSAYRFGNTVGQAHALRILAPQEEGVH